MGGPARGVLALACLVATTWGDTEEPAGGAVEMRPLSEDSSSAGRMLSSDDDNTTYIKSKARRLPALLPQLADICALVAD